MLNKILMAIAKVKKLIWKGLIIQATSLDMVALINLVEFHRNILKKMKMISLIINIETEMKVRKGRRNLHRKEG